MKKKLLYVSHINWEWIKQRPQFIAEELSKYYDVFVLYPHNYNKKGFQKKNETNLSTAKYYYLPLISRVKCLSKINVLLKKIIISRKIKEFHPEILFLTLPDQINEMPNQYEGMIVYDCMDDHAAFYTNEDKKAEIIKMEQNMVSRAHRIFVSSENLRNVLILRYGNYISDKIFLCRNGYSGEVKKNVGDFQFNNDKYTICYFGTISNWFNLEYIEKSLKEFDNIKYLLVGPLDKVVIPNCDGIEYVGTVEHNQLYDVVKNADCFVMPFILNELIKSVDPVKFYEYINFNKNILTIRYDEIERFEEFVYFYTDYKSYVNQLRAMMDNPCIKYDERERVQFLEKSSWSSRVEEMKEIINAYQV